MSRKRKSPDQVINELRLESSSDSSTLEEPEVIGQISRPTTDYDTSNDAQSIASAESVGSHRSLDLSWHLTRVR